MKLIYSILISAFFFCLPNAAVASDDIFVSPSGNDSASGNASNPLATVEAALKKAAEGTTIHLGEGIFRITQPIEISATDISIIGAGMGKTSISGAVELPHFKEYAKGIWYIDLSGSLPCTGPIRQLFVNGRRAVLARTPNGIECFKTVGGSEVLIDTTSDRGARQGLSAGLITLSPEQLKALDGIDKSNPQDVIITLLHKWDVTKRALWSVDDKKSIMYFAQNSQKPWNHVWEVSQFYFEGDKSFMDDAGEYFYDEGEMRLYYMPREGETLETSTAEIPVVRQFMNIKDSKNIIFKDLTFEYSRLPLSWKGLDPSQGAAASDASVMISGSQGISFTDCEVAHTGNYGIWFKEGCEECSVSRCYIHDLGIGGVKIGSMSLSDPVTKNVTVDNCIIKDGCHDVECGEGVIIFHSSDNAVTHNEICDFYYTGVSVGWVWGYTPSPAKRNRVEYNHIHHIGWGLLSDMAAVYTLGLSEGTVVSNNVVHDILSYGYGGWGLYTDEGSTGILMENNLVFGCKSGGFHQHYGENNVIRNNIFLNQSIAQLEATRVEDHNSFTFTSNIVCYTDGNMWGKNWDKVHFVADKNLYWHFGGEASFNGQSIGEWREATGKDLHSIIADPAFVNISSGDFRMQNKKALKRIGFKQFDWTQAGVSCSDEWENLAKYNPDKALSFDRIKSNVLTGD